MVRMASLGVLGAVSLAILAGCASNPPPRPMPQPVTQRGQTEKPQQATETPEAQVARRDTAPLDAAREAPLQAGQSTQPRWYRQGAYEVDGREHRAFSVTAGDVREARGQAMLLAYETYPDGEVAAHEAVRQPDGSWRFYVLMAAGG